VLEGFCRQPLRRLSPTIRNILRVGAYQLLDLDRIPARAAVDEAVRLTRQKGAKGMSGVVNAVLRALDRDRSEPVFPDPEKDLVGHLSIRYSHPDWMVRRWLQRYGADNTRRLCEANNQIPPITLRANTLRVDRDRLEREIGPLVEKIEPCRVSALGLKTAGGQLIGTEPYRKGWFYIQDEAAQLVVQALDPRPGETVLDACAAPGGKSTQMAAAMENRGRVIANDPDAARLGLVRENCRRLGAGIVECRSEDMINPGGLRGERIDKILLDV
ncbi:MAG: 16S rRNA (cytosine(967)-C(5))-methyltransferase RsmB, partial [Planctomycetales bacterium]|nr:16S rRNA (cytosine(967)-C(5))-methyltransferase RsmB [Planctomycetales bacterium]